SELQPGSWDARVQEALLRIDQQRYDEAVRRIEALAASAPAEPARRVAVHELRAALAEAQGLPVEALHAYQEVLALEPDHRHALRSEALLLAQAGTPAAALATAQGRPRLHFATELASLKQGAVGERVRWAIAERDMLELAPSRFLALDRVIDDGERLATELATAVPQATDRDAEELARVRRRLDADRVVALFQRGRYSESIALYRKLADLPDGAPHYATAAAAGAHAQLRRPDLAVPLYEAALRDGGDAVRMPSDIHVGLVYAYLDTARFREADALLDTMIARTPQLLELSPERGRPNDDYGDLLGLRALIDLYMDRPARAERGFAQLSELAPLNAAWRTGQARTMRLREHPQAARAEFEEILTDHPTAVDARAGLAETLFDNGELGAARQQVDALAQTHPEHAAVRSAVRTRDTVMAPRLEIDASAGRDGGTLANRDASIEAHLYSGWSDAGRRFFYHQWSGTADLGASEPRHTRAGVGLQWLQGPLRWSAELHQSSSGSRRTGVALAGQWRASDAWLFGANVDTNTVALPWRAREAGVSGRSAQVEASFIANESRRITANASTLDLSDGNDRRGVGVAWRERWYSGPRVQFETTLAADAARHGSQAVPYFSPEREHGTALTSRLQLLTWKRDDAQLLQVAEAGVGRYSQAGFGSGPTTVLRYAHEWNWDAGWRLRYGVGTSTHPYDGTRERRREVFLHFSMPFQ
ncbi:MAG: poly-beta-1,6 N-acetyl-D-glucosamine export porin PgaA, partial [Comamonadaceae bacterium]